MDKLPDYFLNLLLNSFFIYVCRVTRRFMLRMQGELNTFPPKTPTENEKNFFSISTTRLAESVEGLNSSLAQSPGGL